MRRHISIYRPEFNNVRIDMYMHHECVCVVMVGTHCCFSPHEWPFAVLWICRLRLRYHESFTSNWLFRTHNTHTYTWWRKVYVLGVTYSSGRECAPWCLSCKYRDYLHTRQTSQPRFVYTYIYAFCCGFWFALTAYTRVRETQNTRAFCGICLWLLI